MPPILIAILMVSVSGNIHASRFALHLMGAKMQRELELSLYCTAN